MKKLIAFIIIISTLAIVSCGKKPNDPVEPKPTKFYSSETYHGAIDMPSRVLLVQSGGLYYYSKVDGGSYRFCFNPLCQHTFAENCPSRLFISSSSMPAIVAYSEETERVYLARGQKLYSTSFDASDLRLEFSLGEKGGIEEQRYDIDYIRWLRCYDKYLYFMYRNDNTGHEQVFRYDTSSKKIEEMTSGENEWVMGYEIADGYVYFKMLNSDNIITYVTADMDFKNRKTVDDPIYPTSGGVSMGVFDGKRFYERAPEGIFGIDPLTGEKELISDDPLVLGWAQVLAVKDDGIYFVSDEQTVVGKQYDAYMQQLRDVKQVYYKIYRLSFDGKMQCVLNMPRGYIQSMNFVEDGVIVNFMSYYVGNAENLSQNGYLFVHFEIDDNGNFINPKPIGNLADDAAIIEALASSDTLLPITETTASTQISEPTHTSEPTETSEPTQTSEPTETPVVEIIDPLTLPIVGEYTSIRGRIKFKGFADVPIAWRIKEDYPYLLNTSITLRDTLSSRRSRKTDFIIVTVLGYSYEQDKYGKMKHFYYVNVQRYGEPNTDPTVYKMTHGDPSMPVYGVELLEIGQQYLTKSTLSLYKTNEDGYFSSYRLAMPLIEQDGELYVYNCTLLKDMPKLKCAIKITDKTENLIYKPGRDDDVIEYMKKNNIPAPTYGYKCKLDEFIEEVCDYTVYDVRKITPVGEYTSIKEQVPFESFAELPVEMRKYKDNPYIIKEQKNILDCVKLGLPRDYVLVAIAGYIGEEIGDDGMVYSYYYVYADVQLSINGGGTTRYYYDDTVYIMKAYGSPAHPYYGQKRYEIGDLLLRYETDLEYIRTGEILDATSLFLVDESRKDFFLDLAYPDFNFSYDTARRKGVETITRDVYVPSKDDDIIAYMKENDIEAPVFHDIWSYDAIIYILCDYFRWNDGK